MLRVAIGGKGGVGKTTVASLLARILAKRGYSVIAIDGDPNPNLAVSLGVPREAASKIGHIPHDLVDFVLEPDGRRRIVFRKRPAEIIWDHAYKTHEGIAVLSVGTVEKAGAGCLCGNHAVMREFVRHLLSESKDIIIYDMEASIEHMGRGTVKYLDMLLIVVEPYYKAVETAKRMAKLARDLGMSKIYVVANKIRGEKDLELIRGLLEPEKLEVIGSIPYDTSVLEAEKLGASVLEVNPGADIVKSVESLADKLFELAGLKPSGEQADLRATGSQCPYRIA